MARLIVTLPSLSPSRVQVAVDTVPEVDSRLGEIRVCSVVVDASPGFLGGQSVGSAWLVVNFTRK